MPSKTKEDILLIARLFRRAGFGANYEQMERYAARGYEAAVEELLQPEGQPALDDDLILRFQPGQQGRQGHDRNQVYWVYKMVNSPRLLEEKIALFWHSVHCTAHSKVDYGRQMSVTVDLFRQYGMGSFRTLLLEVARDPGMLYFLDNNVNHKGAINENWGRELLELFSMGVGNYTEEEYCRGATFKMSAPFMESSPVWPR